MTIKAMQHEIESLKEQVALYAGIDDEKACIAHLLDRANETIAQQAEQIAGLVATNATLDAEWRKVTADKFAELAEAIRLKDEAIKLLYSWANNWDSEFMNDPDWESDGYPAIKYAMTTIDEALK